MIPFLNHRSFSLRRLLALRALLAAGALALTAGQAHAAFVFTLSQVGNNVQISGSGTLNTTALTFSSNTNAAPGIEPSTGLLFNGPSSSLALYTGVSFGPTNFGTGSTFTQPNTGTGNGVAYSESAHGIYVPQGYVSGAMLSDSDTYNNATFSSLGFTPGTYTYTWGTGATADSLTVTSGVPEPSTWALLGVGMGLLALTLRRQRQQARAS